MTALAVVVGGACTGDVRLMLDAAAHRGTYPMVVSAGDAVLGCAVPATRIGGVTPLDTRGAAGATIVFDGRLDNRGDLLRALEAPLESSDAALALRACEHWGEAAPQRLLGDFAFACWDAAARRLLCARDAMAQRPLFYAAHAGRTLIASEPQQILAHPGFPRAIHEGVVAEYLTGNPASIEETLWSGVRRLPPAHALVVDDHGLRQWRYWDFDRDARLDYRGAADYDQHFLALFREAIDCRLRGAASAGVYLSGGLDSSAIAGCLVDLAAVRGLPPIRTFSLTFPGRPLDETPFIDAVVQRYGLNGVRLAGAPTSLDAIASDLERFHDIPTFPNGAVLDPLRRRAAAEVDVVLSGAGGDDWFTGHPLHTADLLRGGRFVQALREYRHDVALLRYATPASLLRTAVAPLVPPVTRRVLRSLRGAAQPRFDWIRPAFAARVGLHDRLRWPGLPRCRTLVQSQIYLFANALQQTLGEELEDRATCAAGVVSSNPFYDRRLAEFGFALPEEQRWTRGETKVLLRRACRPWLPDVVARRDDKAEFSSVFVEALDGLGGRNFFDRLETVDAGWVDGAVTGRIYDRMARLYRDGRDAYIPLVFSLWAVASVELWLRHCRKWGLA